MRLLHNKLLKEKVSESVSSVLPITLIVFLLSITLAPLSLSTFVMFLVGAVMLIVGMGLFTLGVDMSMIPMGEGIGVQMSKSKKILLSLTACLVLGVIITVAEPDLQVLAEQVPSIPNLVLILTVAAGVGFFLLIAQLRMLLKIPLSYTLVFFYIIVFILAWFAPDDFVPVSFDSGGVTTGPITVPFIMALGIGMAAIRSDKNSSSDSFGLIALCSIGPILSVLLLGIFYNPQSAVASDVQITDYGNTQALAKTFVSAFPAYAWEVATALLPIAVVFVLFQIFSRRFHKRQLLKILSGFIYAYMGLVLFLTGVNVGFMPAGHYIGQTLASGDNNWLLIPIGMLIGYFIVRAEPAVQVLTKQVEEISNGSITQKSIEHSLSIGIAVSAGLSMIRILTGISIMWFLIPGYLVSLAMTFFVPQIFTGIAFDSGGVASGPMTATFLLPLAMGACQAMGGNILTDAFGIVAMVAMTPLLTIQVLGLTGTLKTRLQQKRLRQLPQFDGVRDCILYFDE